MQFRRNFISERDRSVTWQLVKYSFPQIYVIPRSIKTGSCNFNLLDEFHLDGPKNQCIIHLKIQYPS